MAASAGTGKTAVLTGRCARILSDRTDLSRCLERPGRDFYGGRRRADAVPHPTSPGATDLGRARPSSPGQSIAPVTGCPISTIHAFCKRLITEHFFELGLDGGFRVIDADEQSLLKAEALNRTLLWAWDQPDLEPGLEALFARRSVDRFETKFSI